VPINTFFPQSHFVNQTSLIIKKEIKRKRGEKVKKFQRKSFLIGKEILIIKKKKKKKIPAYSLS